MSFLWSVLLWPTMASSWRPQSLRASSPSSGAEEMMGGRCHSGESWATRADDVGRPARAAPSGSVSLSAVQNARLEVGVARARHRTSCERPRSCASRRSPACSSNATRTCARRHRPPRRARGNLRRASAPCLPAQKAFLAAGEPRIRAFAGTRGVGTRLGASLGSARSWKPARERLLRHGLLLGCRAGGDYYCASEPTTFQTKRTTGANYEPVLTYTATLRFGEGWGSRYRGQSAMIRGFGVAVVDAKLSMMQGNQRHRVLACGAHERQRFGDAVLSCGKTDRKQHEASYEHGAPNPQPNRVGRSIVKIAKLQAAAVELGITHLGRACAIFPQPPCLASRRVRAGRRPGAKGRQMCVCKCLSRQLQRRFPRRPLGTPALLSRLAPLPRAPTSPTSASRAKTPATAPCSERVVMARAARAAGARSVGRGHVGRRNRTAFAVAACARRANCGAPCTDARKPSADGCAAREHASRTPAQPNDVGVVLRAPVHREVGAPRSTPVPGSGTGIAFASMVCRSTSSRRRADLVASDIQHHAWRGPAGVAIGSVYERERGRTSHGQRVKDELRLHPAAKTGGPTMRQWHVT